MLGSPAYSASCAGLMMGRLEGSSLAASSWGGGNGAVPGNELSGQGLRPAAFPEGLPGGGRLKRL